MTVAAGGGGALRGEAGARTTSGKSLPRVRRGRRIHGLGQPRQAQERLPAAEANATAFGAPSSRSMARTSLSGNVRGYGKPTTPFTLCRHVKMKGSKEAMGRGGPWSERWKAWTRCSEHANYIKGSAPGDPLRYLGDDIHFVEDFVRSEDLVPEIYNYAEGVLQRKTEEGKGQIEGAKRALDTTGDSGVRGSPSARRRA